MTAPCLLQTTFSTTRVTFHVVCVRRVRVYVVVLYGVRRHVSCVHGVRHASRCNCCMPSSRGILHVVCLRTSSMLRHSTRCYNRVDSVATHCCSAVHRLAMQCTPMLYVVRAHTSSATKTTVSSQTLPRAMQPRTVRPAAHLWSPVRTRHAPYNMPNAIDNMQPACHIQHKANTQVGS
jgi:hypothetical protein